MLMCIAISIVLAVLYVVLILVLLRMALVVMFGTKPKRTGKIGEFYLPEEDYVLLTQAAEDGPFMLDLAWSKIGEREMFDFKTVKRNTEKQGRWFFAERVV